MRVCALHIFSTNARATDFNMQMLSSISTCPQEVKAIDLEKDPRSGQMTPTTVSGKSDDLPDTLQVDINARVMLTRNLDVASGLVNGAFGTVLGFQHGSCSDELSTIYVHFDNNVALARQITHQGMNKNVVPIQRHEETMATYKYVLRRQFPLKLAWGVTVHKVQGMTTNKCVFDMKGIFSPGQSYVALSRCTSLDGLYIQNYDPDKLYRNDQIYTHLNQMPQHPDTEVQQFPKSKLSITHQNIQGLRSKIPDITNHIYASSDIMVYSETFLKSQICSSTLNIEGYSIERKDRKNDSGKGGLLAYIKSGIHYSTFTVPGLYLEHISLCLNKIHTSQIVLVFLYRPRSQNITTTRKQLTILLTYITQAYAGASIVIAGDLNENLLDKNVHPIYDTFCASGYDQHITKPTTTQGSLLDVVYAKACDVSCQVFQTYYSDHEPVKILLFPDSHMPRTTEVTEKQSEACQSHESTGIQMQAIPRSLHQVEKAPAMKTSRQQYNNKKRATKRKAAQPKTVPSQYLAVQNSGVANTATFKGIDNLGNTCYASSILQILLNTPNLDVLLHSQGPLSMYLLSLQQALNDPLVTNLVPEELYQMPMMYNYPTNEQKDAQEFLMFILQWLDNEQQLANPGISTVKDTVWGEVCHLFTCSTCGFSFVNTEPFSVLFTPMIDIGVSPITIEPSDELSERPCSKCHASPTLCNTEVTKAPPVLFVVALRFDVAGNRRNLRLALQQQLTTKHNFRYKLTAVVNHLGVSTHCGHYYVIMKHRTQPHWYRCDDHNIFNTVLPPDSTDAYILVYSLTT